MEAMASYRPTIGLEIHAELKTRTKMFCDSRNDPEEEHANANVCPVCMAHPGTLPVINREAVTHVLRVGAALDGKLADYTEFDRKSYFYPDIPKGYQISQYEHPLVAGGTLNGVAITRVHLEEDTARSSHASGSSLVDFNRAGVPLMELVTEPVIHDAKTAGDFARELQLLLRTLGVSDANLEKGEMRVEANISISADDSFGTKVEVKNLNSFRSVERAIEHEVARQTKLIEEGGTVVQETRGWDEGKQETFHQRFKEGSADYRYFPEPDLPKLVLSELPELRKEALAATLPELPAARRARYESLGIKAADAETIAGNLDFAGFFDEVAEDLADPKLTALAANFFLTDLGGTPGKVTTASLTALVRMFAGNELSSRGAKDTLALLATEGGDPAIIAKEKGLLQVSDEGTLEKAVQEVINANMGVVEEYKAGKASALQYLLGQAMKATKGAGNPSVLRELLEKGLR
jgi:aspartyl-tRNA(Asn)/glutamyl-tRNA(Gln) amidotransferase subunit B